MIEFKDGKKYWDGREINDAFLYGTLVKSPQDYKRYMRESIIFNKEHTVLHCKSCSYTWVLDPQISKKDNGGIPCPKCEALVVKNKKD